MPEKFFNGIENIENHPVSGKKMNGVLPDFDYLLEAAEGIADRMNLMECMGLEMMDSLDCLERKRRNDLQR